MSKSYLDMVFKTLNDNNIRNYSPSQMLEDYESFVTDCERGYEDNIYEYDHDINVRNIIQILIETPYLYQFSEYNIFKEEIVKLDQKFKGLIAMDVLKDKKYWWERGVLKRSYEKYKEDVKRIYGIDVELINK